VPRLSRLGFIDARRTMEPIRRRVRSRGVPPALESHEIFYTEDPSEASELIGKALAPNRLTLGAIGSNVFAASLHGARLRDLSLLYLDLHVATTVDMARCGPYFAVHMPLNGRAVGTVAGKPFEAHSVHAVVTNPDDPLQIRFDHDSPQLIVRIEQEALERYLTRLLGRLLTRPLVFEPTLDLAGDAAMRWHGAVQLLHTEIFYSGSLVRSGLGIGPLEDFLMSTLLMLQPSTYHEISTRPTVPPGRRAVRRAIDYIEHHLAEPINMSDIAEHVGVSARSIQQGFRDELGVTPMGYLRDRRLERSREDLTDAEPSEGVTVTAVAERWGFNHLGTFAALYKKRWGESPSETLRR
jgi:AraC-like DNA-binding protein